MTLFFVRFLFVDRQQFMNERYNIFWLFLKDFYYVVFCVELCDIKKDTRKFHWIIICNFFSILILGLTSLTNYFQNSFFPQLSRFIRRLTNLIFQKLLPFTAILHLVFSHISKAINRGYSCRWGKIFLWLLWSSIKNNFSFSQYA